MKEFKDKVAFITGAAHGFGMKFAEEAASRGMKLALLDQDNKALTELCNQLKNENIEVLELIADVTEEQEVYDAIEKVMSKYGQIDLLINDAGAATGGPIWEVPTRDWEWILHADLMSQVYTLRKVLPIMMKQEMRLRLIPVKPILLSFPMITGKIYKLNNSVKRAVC